MSFNSVSGAAAAAAVVAGALAPLEQPITIVETIAAQMTVLNNLIFMNKPPFIIPLCGLLVRINPSPVSFYSKHLQIRL